MIKKLLTVLLFSVTTLGFAQNAVETDLARLERLKTEHQLDSLEKKLGRKNIFNRGEDKVQYKFGGRIDARLYYDSHDVVDARDGLLLALPAKPSYNNLGEVTNSNDQVRFSLFSSRVNFSVSNIKLGENAKASAFVEGDFMGSTDSYLQLFRLRHAYMKFTWKNDEILVGQASSLTFVDEAQPNCVNFGAKPFNIIHRGAQIRYTRTLAPQVKILAAAEYYSAHKPTGPADAQNNAGYPDMQVRMQFGDPKTVFGGVVGGVKFLRPISEDANGNKINTTTTSASVSAFLAANMDSYTLKLFTIYGSNLSNLGFFGGYGEQLDNPYQFANTRAHCSWLDFESPSFNGFKLGIFAGYQANLGSKTKLNPNSISKGTEGRGYFNNGDVVWSSGVAPRIYYSPIKNVSIGLEYFYLTAVWGKEFDEYYRATERYDNVLNNRVEMLFRFSF